MNKLILFIVTITILLVLWFNFFNTSTTNSPLTTEEKYIKTSKNEIIKKETILNKTQTDIKEINNSSNKLYDEIALLLKKAEKLLEESKDEEATTIYNLILKKTAKTDDPKLLQYFTSACISLGYIYQSYPNIDNDAATAAYYKIINKFEKSNKIEFIKFYIDAKLQLSYLLPYDERVEIYNELLNKFEKNYNKEIEEIIENILIAKSFQLMGSDDEEAMQVLDKVIEKYQESNNTVNLPENIRMSILNNIELALITNNESDTYVDLAKKLMSNSSDTKPILDMLEILKNAQDLNQDEAFAIWKEEHQDYRFEDWSFQEVERWAYHIEDQETKERVSKYINAFVNQKYNTSDKSIIYESSPNSTVTYTDPYIKSLNEDIEIEEVTQNDISEDELTEENPTYEEDSDPYANSESSIYEPDPYAQDIYEATGEYPNPYE